MPSLLMAPSCDPIGEKKQKILPFILPGKNPRKKKRGKNSGRNMMKEYDNRVWRTRQVLSNRLINQGKLIHTILVDKVKKKTLI